MSEQRIRMEWQPIDSAPKDGRRVLLWVCPRQSVRHGFAEVCWRGLHPDWGETWLRHNGKEVVNDGVATHWMGVLPPGQLL